MNSSEEYFELYNSILNMLNGFAYCKMIYKNGKAHDFTYLKVNKAYEDLTGLKNVEGKNVSEVIPGVQKSDRLLIERYGKVASTGLPDKFEYYHNSLGDWFSVSVQCPKKDYFVVIFDVISKRKLIEEELTESENKYRLLFENMVNGFSLQKVILDDNNNPVDFTFVETNKMHAAFTGFSNDTLIGKTVRELIPNADMKMIKKYCNVGITGEPIILEYFSKTFNKYVKVNCYSPKKGYFATIFEDISERKKIEEELKQSRELYKLLADNSTDAIGLIDKDGKVEYVSPSFTRRLGYDVSEMIGIDIQTIMDNIHPDDIENVSNVIQNGRLQKIARSTSEYRIRKKNGDYIWVEDILNREFDEEGNFKRTIINSRDITKRKQIEELLSQTQRNYESFFNTIDEFLFVLNEQGNIIHTNKTVTDRLGFTNEELTGKSILIVHPEERREEAGRIVGEMLSGQADFCPVPLITKSGMQIPVETRVTKGSWDGKPALYGVTKDISDLKLSEEKFSKLFHVNPSACGLSNMETHEYIEVNDAFNDLLGYEKEEVIGKTAAELEILNIEDVANVMLKADKDGKVNNVEAVLKAKNGDLKNVILSAENIYIEDKKYRYTVVHDITQIKRAEEEIIRQKEELLRINAEKDKFFSILAHDLRSPFNGFLGFTQLMVSDINNMSLNDLNKIAVSLHKSANNIYGLLTNLLDWAKMQRGLTLFKPEKLNVRKIIDDTIDISKETAAGKNIQILNNVDSNITIEADIEMLQTIVRNLLSNALKFTNKGGFVLISSISAKDYVDISIKDSGIGMNQELINDLFRIDKKTGRVGTEKEPSSGLGLLLCKEFVEKHNGNITVKSEEGKGSEFIVSFPISV